MMWRLPTRTSAGHRRGTLALKGQLADTFFFNQLRLFLIDADYGDIYNTHKAEGNIITRCAR